MHVRLENEFGLWGLEFGAWAQDSRQLGVQVLGFGAWGLLH